MMRALALAALLILSAAALPSATLADDNWPRTILHAGGELVLDAPPKRIISTSPSLTGIALAIDAPVVATSTALVGPLTDDQGFFRQWAEVAHERNVEVLYTNLTFDIEAVLVQNADLIIGSASGGDSILPHLAELQALGLPVLVIDYSDNSWEEQAAQIGRATGHEAEAKAIAEAFAARAAEVGATLARPAGTVSIVSYDFAGTYAVSQPTSPQARVLEALGFTVTGLPEDLRGMAQRSSDFDFVSHENLTAAITGETVFLLNGTGDSVTAFTADPLLANLPALKEGRVYPLGPTSFRVDYYSALEIIDTVAPFFTK